MFWTNLTFDKFRETGVLKKKLSYVLLSLLLSGLFTFKFQIQKTDLEYESSWKEDMVGKSFM